jgi:hypothetical protein
MKKNLKSKIWYQTPFKEIKITFLRHNEWHCSISTIKQLFYFMNHVGQEVSKILSFFLKFVFSCINLSLFQSSFYILFRHCTVNFAR